MGVLIDCVDRVMPRTDHILNVGMVVHESSHMRIHYLLLEFQSVDFALVFTLFEQDQFPHEVLPLILFVLT